MDTDRNLLFGVLALQLDLIDSEKFSEACAAWAARKEVTLAAILIERGWITATDREDIERLLERKIQRYGGMSTPVWPRWRTLVCGTSCSAWMMPRFATRCHPRRRPAGMSCWARLSQMPTVPRSRGIGCCVCMPMAAWAASGWRTVTT